MRRRWVWDPKLKELVEVDPYARTEQVAPMIVGDLPGYQSPVSGAWIEGRKARRNDLARTGSRPWEGMESERREAARRVAHEEQRRDMKLDEAARRAYHQLSPSKRRAVEGR